MRLPRPRIENCCIHVTHRCHKREYLLGYDLDRRIYRNRLVEAAGRFPAIRVLDYVITSNHVGAHSMSICWCMLPACVTCRNS